MWTALALLCAALAVLSACLLLADMEWRGGIRSLAGLLRRVQPAWWLLAGLVLFVAVFTVLASLIFLAGTGLLGTFPHPFWQWWLYLYEDGGNPAVRGWLLVSGVPAAALPLIAAAVLFWRRRLARVCTLRRLRLAGLVIWGLATWGFLASIIALFLAGDLRLFGRWWWWNFLPYIGQPPVLRAVLESAAFAAAIVGTALGIGLLSSGNRRPRAEPTLYGKTEWASRDDLGRGGFGVIRREK
jgi:hypothetical protein